MLHGSIPILKAPPNTMTADPETQILIKEDFSEKFSHQVVFCRDFNSQHALLQELFTPKEGATPTGVLLVMDKNVAEAYPTLAEEFAGHIDAIERVEFRNTITVPGGEESKNDQAVVDSILEAIDTNRIDRHSWVVVVGGGAVIDAVGFASSIAHRGIRLLKVATTVLAQLDAAIGVKNGVNRFGKKNFVGTFDVPEAVLCPESFLGSLQEKDWQCGFAEAVKIAALQDASFMHAIAEAAPAIRQRDMDAARPIIRQCAERHLQHIARGGDPFERREGRPLDFGHWSAHRLESMSGYTIAHGEAVAIGVALDTVYSWIDGRLSEEECTLVTSTLKELGLNIYSETLGRSDELLAGLEEFREHLGGTLTITLLNGIGTPVDVHDMDHDRILKAIEYLSQHA